MPDSTHSLTARLRFEILRRDRHRCYYCGRTPDDGVKLTVDHVVPVALGGSDDPTNLVTACGECNGGKASVAPEQSTVEAVDERALRWADAMQAAAELERLDRQAQMDGIQLFYNAWTDIFTDDSALVWPWEPSIRTFIKNGMSIEDFKYAISATAAGPVYSTSRLFRYFCGVCWRIINERRATALVILEGPADGSDT